MEMESPEYVCPNCDRMFHYAWARCWQCNLSVVPKKVSSQTEVDSEEEVAVRRWRVQKSFAQMIGEAARRADARARLENQIQRGEHGQPT